MVKPIALLGNPVLRQICLPSIIGTDVKELVQNLWDMMYDADGAGLAAPQINESFRIFVIDLPDQEWKQTFINPVITKFSGEDTTIIFEYKCNRDVTLSNVIIGANIVNNNKVCCSRDESPHSCTISIYCFSKISCY